MDRYCLNLESKRKFAKAQDMLHENEELLSALEESNDHKERKKNVVEKLFSDDIKVS